MNELLDIFNLSFEANLEGPLLLAALVGIGFVVGILTGVFGVGGGFLINPLLLVLLGMKEKLVVGSSLTFTIGTAAAGTARHWRLGNVELKTMLILVAGALPGVLLGKYILGAMEAMGEETFRLTFRSFYLAVLLLTAAVVYRHFKRDRRTKSPLQRLPIGPGVDLVDGKLKDVSLSGLLVVGVVIGAMKGMLGIGGGVLFVPLLMMVVGLGPHLAVGTSLGVVGLSSIFGTILYGTSEGGVNMSLVMILLVGSAVGVQIGGWLSPKLHGKQLQRYFVYVVLVAAVLVAVSLISMLV